MNALMPDFDFHDPRHRSSNDWEGLAEIDRAIAENRLAVYRWTKAWADPVARIGMIVGIGILLAYVGYVIWSDLL